MEPEPNSVVGVPLVSLEKRWPIPAANFPKDHMIQDEQVDLLETVASHTAIALENSRSYLLTQRAYEEIREVDRLKSQFLANMSHELRTH
jgi:GAF domain-containing protein